MSSLHRACLAVVVLFNLGGSVLQAQPVPAQATDWQVQRQQLAEQRAHQEELFQSAQTQCYQRFAVNDCLRAARAQRRAALEELRRQEVILNDLDRQAQAQATLERIGQKLSAESDQPQRAASAP